MSRRQDENESWFVVSHEVLRQAHIVALEQDVVHAPFGATMTREFVSHPGSVAVIAFDDRSRIAVVSQYRHPVGMRLVEPPAGL
ncbi:MAG: ADP-ribose pyrophosphatase, partial [Propionibacteriaceae bacterium]|nr:ADP-ribose pyrophosphatase [Propionibacteriaceae bacterium]